MSAASTCHDIKALDDDSTCTTAGLFSVPTLVGHYQTSPTQHQPARTTPDDYHHRYMAASRRRSSMSSRGSSQRDDDFLLMEVQAHTSSSVDNLLDDDDEDDVEHDDIDGQAASTWGLLDRTYDTKLWTESFVQPALVTARETRSSMTTMYPQVVEQLPLPEQALLLEEEYRRTKIRFIESMLRTERSRAIIQYQRRLFIQTSSVGTSNDLTRERLLTIVGSQYAELYSYQYS